MNKKLTLLFPLVLAGCSSLYTVSPSTGSQTGGIHYYLPKNKVEVAYKVTNVLIEKGHFHSEAIDCLPPEEMTFYAEQWQAMEDDGKLSRIKLENVTFNLSGVQDTDHGYFVDLGRPGNPFLSRGGSFTLNQSQILTSATASATNEAVDFVIELGQTFATLANAAQLAVQLPARNLCDPDAARVYSDLADVRTQLQGLVQVGDLTTEVYEAKRADLQAREETLLGHFIGQKTVTIFNGSVSFEPERGVTCIALFEEDMSPTRSLYQVAKHRYEVNQETVRGRGYTCESAFELRIRPELAEGNDATGEAGFYYRQPGSALVDLIRGTDIIARASLPIAQFGVVRALPQRYGMLKSEITEFSLDPVTGGIQKLGVNGTNLGQDQVDSLNALLAEDRKDTTLPDLQRQHDILKLQQEIGRMNGTVSLPAD